MPASFKKAEKGDAMIPTQEGLHSGTEDPFSGRMNDPTAAATLTGPCGDTMEVYLLKP
jgi:hypothetical protein